MSIEAMKQALEALEWNLPVIEDYGDKEQLNRQHKAITSLYDALRQAIEQAEKQEPVAWDSGVPPLYPQIKNGETVSVEYLEPTPQPQREWIGLTQQDIDIAFDDTQEGGGFNEFAEAIEAKLKEKNT